MLLPIVSINRREQKNPKVTRRGTAHSTSRIHRTGSPRITSLLLSAFFGIHTWLQAKSFFSVIAVFSRSTFCLSSSVYLFLYLVTLCYVISCQFVILRAFFVVIMSCATPPTQLRGACGHVKAKFDNHVTCLRCTGCSFESLCEVCSAWPAEH